MNLRIKGLWILGVIFTTLIYEKKKNNFANEEPH